MWFAKAGILAAAVAEAAPGATEINAALAAEAPLDGALQLTLMALAHPVPRHEAAQVRVLCVCACVRTHTHTSFQRAGPHANRLASATVMCA